MTRRSALVVTAVTLQRLAEGSLDAPSVEEALVLEALRRSKTSLREATVEELGAYIRGLSPEQLGGVLANVKGIFHELLVERSVDMVDNGVEARLFAETNHPGADLEFIVDGEVIREVQIKAVQTPAAIIDHFAAYSDIDVITTSEVQAAAAALFPGRVESSGFSNEALTEQTLSAFDSIDGQDLAELTEDGLLSSALAVAALESRAILSGQRPDPARVRDILEGLGVGLAATLAMEALIGAL